nr:MAG TPA: hypothetical protein [Caudoviricetes sp.]
MIFHHGKRVICFKMQIALFSCMEFLQKWLYLTFLENVK